MTETPTPDWNKLGGEFFPTVIPEEGRAIERPVLYISRVTKPYEANYQATELELSCIAWAFGKLQHLLEGSDVTIVSDHEAIKGVLHSAPGTRYSQRIDKARMALMPHLDKITIEYRPGKSMQMVDPLSRGTYTTRQAGDQTTQTRGTAAAGEGHREADEDQTNGITTHEPTSAQNPESN